jgi:hypothetical protein
MAGEADEKKKLLETILKTSAEAERIETDLREAQQKAHFAGEIAQGMHQYYSALPEERLTADEWSRQTGMWQGLYESAAESRPALTFSNTFWARTYAVATTSNTVVFSTDVSGLVEAPLIHAVQGRIVKIFQRTPLLDDARAGIRRLGLDHVRGHHQTALSHLEAAQNALGSGATPALISVREAINTTVAQLIARRPKQEKASSHRDKVVSIGKQCGRPSLNESYFEELGTDGQRLVDRLSGSKGKALTRQEVSDLFNEGLVYMNALLGSLDCPESE